MKYYLLEVAEGDEKIAGKAVYEYATEIAVIAAFHKRYGQALDSPLYTSVLVMAIAEDGKVIERGSWKK